MKELGDIYATLGRAVKLNKSLLLLSRIENGQYAEVERVSVDEVVDKLLPDLLDIYENKQIQLVRKRDEQPLLIQCNQMLAQILITNLLKNALVKKKKKGELHVITSPKSMTVKNTGTVPLDDSRLFHRFYRGSGDKHDSTGLGLAIAHSIAQSASLSLTYELHDGMHCFILALKS